MTTNADCEVLAFIRFASRVRIKNTAQLLKEDVPPAFAYVLANELRTNRQIARRCAVYLNRFCQQPYLSHNNAQKSRLDVAMSKINMRTAAELLIVSATAEVIGITRRLTAGKGCSERVMIFCEKVVESENDFIERLRSFL